MTVPELGTFTGGSATLGEVAALGSLQTAVEDRFSQLLDATRTHGMTDPPGGMLVGGGFGSGKSHVLEHLAHRALDAGFWSPRS